MLIYFESGMKQRHLKKGREKKCFCFFYSPSRFHEVITCFLLVFFQITWKCLTGFLIRYRCFFQQVTFPPFLAVLIYYCLGQFEARGTFSCCFSHTCFSCCCCCNSLCRCCCILVVLASARLESSAVVGIEEEKKK